MSDQPQGKCHYPIKQSAEHRTSRRQFFTFAGGSFFVLLASAVASKGAWFRNLFYRRGETSVAIANEGELAVGESKLFHYPTSHDPCILIHLSEGSYVAYTQKCTHLMCPVHYNKDKEQIVCPCHEGYFSPKDGKVLAGPPPRPLPSFPVEVRQGKIWVLPGQPLSNRL